MSDKGLKILLGLSALAILAYIGVNFVAPLPKFLVAENVFMAVLIGAAAYMAAYKRDPAYLPVLSLIAAFGAGRMSRSVIQPDGSLAPLARDHAGMLLLLLAIAVLSAYYAFQNLKRR